LIKKKFQFLGIAILEIVLLFGLAGCFSSNKKLIQVPDFRGVSLEEAKQLAKAKGLKVIISDNGFFPSVKKGYVVTQTPFPNTNVKKDRTIALQISNGPAVVIMPDLFGMEFGKASEAVARLNLYFEVVEEDPDWKDPDPKDDKNFDLGYIVKQIPSPGSEIISGSGVKVTVYKPMLQLVPNLIDVTLDDARSMIASSGYFVGTIIFKESRNHARGVVTVQEPIPGSPAEAGSLINLTINEKP
jgi:eukaryotic-like serine/threonine-protein kinase